MCSTWNAAPRNLPEYGERYVEKVANGTGETLPCTLRWSVKRNPITEREMEDGRKGVGGVHSTDEVETTKLYGEKEPCFVQELKGGKSE